ncbi:MAG: hypothetical protein RBS39_11960 [Phycisphaerales bacterium]|jgi:hypothetical protein|nr:hypothetical protein [Phycisphaerales bacterium]
MNGTSLCAVIAASWAVLPALAQSTNRLIRGSVPSGQAALASFTIDDAKLGASLLIRIENEISPDFDGIDDRVLTGMFFNIDGFPGQISPFQLIDRSKGVNGWEATSGVIVGSEVYESPLKYWAFRDDLGRRAGDENIPDEFNSPNFGFGTVELGGVFTNAEILSGANDGDLNDLDHGILSPTGLTPILPDELPVYRQFIEFRVYFTAPIFANGLPEIRNVSWLFGRSFQDSFIPDVPAPGAAGLLLSAGVLAAGRRRR